MNTTIIENAIILTTFTYPRQNMRSSILTFLWRDVNTVFNPWAKAHGYKHTTPPGLAYLLNLLFPSPRGEGPACLP